jgi:hypothetical protein
MRAQQIGLHGQSIAVAAGHLVDRFDAFLEQDGAGSGFVRARAITVSVTKRLRARIPIGSSTMPRLHASSQRALQMRPRMAGKGLSSLMER